MLEKLEKIVAIQKLPEFEAGQDADLTEKQQALEELSVSDHRQLKMLPRRYRVEIFKKIRFIVHI